MLKPGISQIGGNFRTRKVLLANTPYHEYFLSLFTGSGIYEFNKPKAHHYECLNEINPEFVNYFIVIKKFFKEFEERRKKGLTKEILVYADPPFPGTEHYYGDLFKPEDHYDLIDIMIDCPFNFMLSIGKDCGFYLDALRAAGWFIKEISIRYSTNANAQKLSKEYICTNYDIKKIPKMIMDNQILLTKYMEA